MNDESSRLDRLEAQMNKHDKLFRGDLDTEPPKPGLQQVLQEIWNELRDPERGNTAMHKRLKEVETRDLIRVAWFGGAKWVIIALAGVLGYLVSLAVHH